VRYFGKHLTPAVPRGLVTARVSLFMNKDQVKGKVKDVAGRIERQAGEWTGDREKQVHGAMKQVEGKVQNAWGNAKDAAEKADKRNSTDSTQTNSARTEDRTQRKAG